MTRKKKMNKNLVTVLVISVALHIVAFMVLGSVVIFQAVVQSEPEFEAPVVPVSIEPEQLQMRSNMRQRTQQSAGATRARPQQRITVSNAPQMPGVQALNLSVAPPASGVSMSGVGTGSAGSGSGSGLGALGGTGGIGVGMRSVTFLGVQSGGERVAILVDTSNFMMLDEKGGLHAFRLVKDECVKVIEALEPGVVFNIYLYSGATTVNRFKPHMVTASPGVIREVKAWLAPINEDARSLGARTNNFTPEREYFKGSGYTFANFGRALHAAFVDQAEAIFMITAGWPNIRQHMDDFDEAEQKRKQAELDRRIRDWERNHKAAREKWQQEVYQPARKRAEEILKAENDKRRAEGKPPRVVLHIDYVIRENNLYTRPAPPHRPVLPYYTPEEIITRIQREMFKTFYRDAQKQLPSINIILFGEDKAAEDNYRRLVRSSRLGNFRKIPSLLELESARSQSRDQRSSANR